MTQIVPLGNVQLFIEQELGLEKWNSLSHEQDDHHVELLRRSLSLAAESENVELHHVAHSYGIWTVQAARQARPQLVEVAACGLPDFLDRWDELTTPLAPGCKVHCEQVSPSLSKLRCSLPSLWLCDLLEGMVEGVAKLVFNDESATLAREHKEDDQGRVTMLLTVTHAPSPTRTPSLHLQTPPEAIVQWDQATWAAAFPCSFTLHPSTLEMVQAGPLIHALCPGLALHKVHAGDLFRVSGPWVTTWQEAMEKLALSTSTHTIALTLRSTMTGGALTGTLARVHVRPSAAAADEAVVMFVGTPTPESAAEMKRNGLALADLPPHSAAGQVVVLAEEHAQLMEVAGDMEAELQEAEEAMATLQDEVEQLQEALSQALAQLRAQEHLPAHPTCGTHPSAAHRAVQAVDDLLQGGQVSMVDMLMARSLLGGVAAADCGGDDLTQRMMAGSLREGDIQKLLGGLPLSGAAQSPAVAQLLTDMLTGGASAPSAAATRPRMSRVRRGQSSLSLSMRQQADRDVSDHGSDAPDSPTSTGSSSYSVHSGSSGTSSAAPTQLLASPRLDQGQQLASSQLLESDQGMQGASLSGDVSTSPASAENKQARRSVKAGLKALKHTLQHTFMPSKTLHQQQGATPTTTATISNGTDTGVDQGEVKVSSGNQLDDGNTSEVTEDPPISPLAGALCINQAHKVESSSCLVRAGSDDTYASATVKLLRGGPRRPPRISRTQCSISSPALGGHAKVHGAGQDTPDGTSPSAQMRFTDLSSRCVRTRSSVGGNGGSPHRASYSSLHTLNSSSNFKAPTIHHKADAVMTLYQSPPDHLASILGHVGDWQFCSFKLSEATHGRPLSVLGFAILQHSGLVARFKLDPTRLARFLVRVEEGYAPNPYHSRIHAADVLRSLHVLLTQGGVLARLCGNCSRDHGCEGRDVHAKGLSTDHGAERSAVKGPLGAACTHQPQGTSEWLELLGCYLAAIVHDYEHRGVNNAFLVRSHSDLAITYNDQSPMEHHHVAAAWRLMNDPKYAFLPHLAPSALDSLRTNIIELVLGTDMKQHFGLVSAFKTRMAAAEAVALAAAAPKPPPPASTTTMASAFASPHAARFWGACGVGESGAAVPMAHSLKATVGSKAPGGLLHPLQLSSSIKQARFHSKHTLQERLSTVCLQGHKNHCIADPARPRHVGNGGLPPSLLSARQSVDCHAAAGGPADCSLLSFQLAPETPTTTPEGDPKDSCTSNAATLKSRICPSKTSVAPHTHTLNPLPHLALHHSLPCHLLQHSRSTEADAAAMTGLPVQPCEQRCATSGGEGCTVTPPTTTAAPTAPPTAALLPAPPSPSLGPHLDAEGRLLAFKMALKAADVAHLASPWETHQRWVQLLEEEMFRQGDREKALGLPVSALMDRDSGGITLSQPGFFNLVALPLYTAFVAHFPGCAPLLSAVQANLARWEGKAAGVEPLCQKRL